MTPMATTATDKSAKYWEDRRARETIHHKSGGLPDPNLTMTRPEKGGKGRRPYPGPTTPIVRDPTISLAETQEKARQVAQIGGDS